METSKDIVRSASRPEFERPIDGSVIDLIVWMIDTAKTLTDARDAPADVMPILSSQLKQVKLWMSIALKRLESDSTNKNIIAAVDYGQLALEGMQKCVDMVDVSQWPKGGKWELLRTTFYIVPCHLAFRQGNLAHALRILGVALKGPGAEVIHSIPKLPRSWVDTLIDTSLQSPKTMDADLLKALSLLPQVHVAWEERIFAAMQAVVAHAAAEANQKSFSAEMHAIFAWIRSRVLHNELHDYGKLFQLLRAFSAIASPVLKEAVHELASKFVCIVFTRHGKDLPPLYTPVDLLKKTSKFMESLLSKTKTVKTEIGFPAILEISEDKVPDITFEAVQDILHYMCYQSLEILPERVVPLLICSAKYFELPKLIRQAEDYITMTIQELWPIEAQLKMFLQFEKVDSISSGFKTMMADILTEHYSAYVIDGSYQHAEALMKEIKVSPILTKALESKVARLVQETIVDKGYKVVEYLVQQGVLQPGVGVDPVFEAIKLGDAEFAAHLILDCGVKIRISDAFIAICPDVLDWCLREERFNLLPLILEAFQNANHSKSLLKMKINNESLAVRAAKADDPNCTILKWIFGFPKAEKAPAVLLAAMSAETPFSAEFLLKHGFDPSVQDTRTLTLTHWAAQRGYVGVLQALTDAKGDLFFTDPNGILAVYFAKKYEQKEAYDWLIRHGCKDEELSQQQKDRINPKPPSRASFEGNRSARTSMDNPRRRSQEFETRSVDQGLQSLIDRTLDDQ
eukprot:TRINITY_DN6483_c0_g1_i2.p1 TRINITY_DN6483_c0_g1~~TRINITY_DN6483_c0_g1_i2.p1  ORF type:complete len:761 (+),score=96.47 TRINITY_DN6483_c0_g1_i2:60-2285(+)